MDRSLFGSLLNTVPSAIFWKDNNLVFQGCNRKFAEQFGYATPEEIIGKTDYDFPFPRHLIDLYRADDKEIIETRQPRLNYEEVQVQSDGSEKIVLLSKVPVLDEHQEVIGILGIYTDITDRKRHEEQLKKAKEAAEAANRAKTEFLENMRHDIRTPLTGIVGFADILKNEAREPKIKGYADSLVASSYALLKLLDEVLESIRVSAGEIPHLKKKFNLRSVFQDIIALNFPKAKQKKLDFHLEIDPNLPRYVIGDKTRIHRIALELVVNALNFTSKGLVNLEVKLAQKNARELVVKLIVEDTGIGIPKERQQEIYLQFKRLSPSYTGLHSGIGLGLSVIKQFVDDLQGEIYVDSAPGEGTKFTCLFPLTEALLDDDEGVDHDIPLLHPLNANLPAIEAPIVDITPAAIESCHHVLLVEDNLVAQAVAKTILTSFQCKVDIASNREMALSLVQNQPYELVFLDIGLPDGDGVLLAKELQVMMADKAQECSFIALTAHLGEESRQRCYAHGLKAVVSKPLTPERCHQILTAYLPKKELSPKPYCAEIKEVPILDIQEGIKNTNSQLMLEKSLRLLVEQSIPEEMENLHLAYEAKNWQNIQRIVHKIKGGAVYTGTKRLHQICEALELLIRNQVESEYEPAYQLLIRVLTETSGQASLWLANTFTEA